MIGFVNAIALDGPDPVGLAPSTTRFPAASWIQAILNGSR